MLQKLLQQITNVMNTSKYLIVGLRYENLQLKLHFFNRLKVSLHGFVTIIM